MLFPSCLATTSNAVGSKIPLLVPIGIPSSGVNPIDVSTHTPPLTADKDAPFPKWHTITLTSLTSLPINSAHLCETNLWDVPCAPYLRIAYLVYHSYGVAYIYASGAIVWWNVVSNTTTCATDGNAFWKALIPITWAGLWSGAKADKSETFWITSSSTKHESLKNSPPCTTRWPTPVISSKLFTIPFSTNASNNNSTPTAWSTNTGLVSSFLPLYLIVKIPGTFSPLIVVPIFSIIPEAITSSCGISNNWNLIDELPAFTAIIFAILIYLFLI